MSGFVNTKTKKLFNDRLKKLILISCKYRVWVYYFRKVYFRENIMTSSMQEYVLTPYLSHNKKERIPRNKKSRNSLIIKSFGFVPGAGLEPARSQ
jgi:hypothetical protein